jgi:hypothetical protein
MPGRNAVTERPPTGGSTDSPWTQRRFLASAGVLALIVVLGIAAVLLPGGGKDPAPAAPAETTTTVAGAAGADPAASVCGLPAGDQKVPKAAPKDTRWELVGTMAAPTAPKTLGPGKSTGGLRSCFAHSPTGALYAGINFIALTANDSTRDAAAEALLSKGTGRDAALSDNAGSEAADGTRMQVAGFRFLSYDTSTAVIDLALRIFVPPTQATYLHFPATMRWQDGDWKLVAPPDGQVYGGMQPVADLTGYLPWSGA